MVRKRKIPQRKCLITNEMKPKKELIRIVRNKEGEVFVDLSGKKNGRGAYLSNDPKVIDQAEQSNVLGKQLNANIDPSLYKELKSIVDGNQHEK
ncbi:MAG TPA: YlxR family protein [Virgibacillus sp.]|nr:YlxR family protein [Virgibacillus sp.]